MRHYNRDKSLILILVTFFVSIDLYAQIDNQKSENVYDVSIVSKGQGSIFCNEQYLVDIDERKEFTLKNNADVRLSLSAKEGHKLSKFTINGINRLQDIKNNRITLKGISHKTVIVATFEETNDSVNLTIISGAGGTLNYNGESLTDTKKYTLVKKNTKISLNINPQKGFKFEKLSVNGILRDVSNNTYSFEIRRNSIVKVSFSESPPVRAEADADEKPKFEISVSGPGKAILSGEINGVVAGDPKHPSYPNREDFYVTNGSDVTIKLVPVQNIKKFVIGLDDLTQTVKSSNGIYTVGVTHEFPKFGLTSAFVEFIQRYNIIIESNKYGSYTPSYNLKRTQISDCFLIDEGKKGEIELNAKEHYHLEKLIVNGIDLTKNVVYLHNNGTEGGPTYKFDLGEVRNDYKIVVTFVPDPILTINCGRFGRLDRALSIYDPTKYLYYADPQYDIDPGKSKSFYEPSAAKGSSFYGRDWILRSFADVGYKLAKVEINGVDMTSIVKRIPPNGPRYNQEICYIPLGFIKKDTKVEIAYIKAVQQTPQAEWVDLGIGVKWATRNVGADKATDAGNYFTWKGANALKVQKGRLPTEEEVTRLMKECHPEPCTQDGVAGVRFYHRSNRNISIFIPAAGIYSQTDPDKLNEKGVEGAIWTSTDSRSLTAAFLDWFSVDRKFALAFSIKDKKIKKLEADAGARISVRLVLDMW